MDTGHARDELGIFGQLLAHTRQATVSSASSFLVVAIGIERFHIDLVVPGPARREICPLAPVAQGHRLAVVRVVSLGALSMGKQRGRQKCLQ
jgi:hypothetical protein